MTDATALDLPRESADGPFYCEVCERRYADGAVECPHCEDEPLLDLQDPEVRQMLQAFDERDRTKRMTRFTLLACVVCLPFWLFAHIDPRAAIGGYILGVLGLSSLLLKMFPARKRVPS